MLRKWELLDCDDKAKWVPQGHRTVLANDETWAPLLSDGPPLCGKAPEKEEPGEAKAEDEEVVQDEEKKGGEKEEKKKKEPTRDKKRKSEQNLDIPKRLKSSQAPESNEPTCGAVAQYASSTCTTAAQGLQDRGKRMIFVSSKQCAVPGVSWHKRGAWQVSWREKNERKYKKLNVRDFMKTSETFCKAEADALSAAIKFRKSLEKRGVGMAKRAQNPQSNVPGVNWHRPKKAWMVQLQVKGKRLSGGCFKPKDSTPDEVECARLAAVESRRKLEQKYFKISRVESCFA